MNELKQQILDLVNNSGLPLEAIIFVVKDIWRDAEETYQAAKQKQLKKEEKQQEEHKE